MSAGMMKSYLVMFFLTLALSCGGSGDSTLEDAGDHTTADILNDNGSSDIQENQYTVGPDGEDIETDDGVRLEIPPDALDQTVVIDIKIIEAPDLGNTDFIPVGSVYSIGPTGTQFLEPVRLSLPFIEAQLPGDADPEDVTIWTRTDPNSSWQDLGGAVDGTSVEVTIDHLSEFVPALGCGIYDGSDKCGSDGCGEDCEPACVESIAADPCCEPDAPPPDECEVCCQGETETSFLSLAQCNELPGVVVDAEQCQLVCCAAVTGLFFHLTKKSLCKEPTHMVVDGSMCDEVCCGKDGKASKKIKGLCINDGGQPLDYEDCEDVCCDCLDECYTATKYECEQAPGCGVIDMQQCADVCCFMDGVHLEEPACSCAHLGVVAGPVEMCDLACCDKGYEVVVLDETECDYWGWLPMPLALCDDVCCVMDPESKVMKALECEKLGEAEPVSECEQQCCDLGLGDYKFMAKVDCEYLAGDLESNEDKCVKGCCSWGLEMTQDSKWHCEQVLDGIFYEDLSLCTEVCCKVGDVWELKMEIECNEDPDATIELDATKCEIGCCVLPNESDGFTYEHEMKGNCEKAIAEADTPGGVFHEDGFLCDDVCCKLDFGEVGELPDLECSDKDGKEIDLLGCPDMWQDPDSGLMWSVSETGLINWNDAEQDCQVLSTTDYSDWRMPTIDELRTLVRDCPQTAPGGTCPASESCSLNTCLGNYGDCTCEPKTQSCDYLPEPLKKAWSCHAFYWSSTTVTHKDWGELNQAWGINFTSASITTKTKDLTPNTIQPTVVHCIRP